MNSLLKRGYRISAQEIIKNVYETESYSSMKLKGEVLSNLQIVPENQIAWASVKQSALDSLGADWEDTEGLVNYPRSLKGIEVGLLFKEVEQDKTRLSLRSNDYFQVNEFAHHFGGGGHPRAAGCTVNKPLAEAEKEVIEKLKSEIGIK
jgi:phosphoesterase RecJ-like protein